MAGWSSSSPVWGTWQKQNPGCPHPQFRKESEKVNFNKKKKKNTHRHNLRFKLSSPPWPFTDKWVFHRIQTDWRRTHSGHSPVPLEGEHGQLLLRVEASFYSGLNNVHCLSDEAARLVSHEVQNASFFIRRYTLESTSNPCRLLASPWSLMSRPP